MSIHTNGLVCPPLSLNKSCGSQESSRKLPEEAANLRSVTAYQQLTLPRCASQPSPPCGIEPIGIAHSGRSNAEQLAHTALAQQTLREYGNMYGGARCTPKTTLHHRERERRDP
ncbi:unnamed protein product, partial [Ectocarpus sp. 12 AP-2014]